MDNELYESVTVPLSSMRAALSVASRDPGRFYLNGVYLHRVDGTIRMVGTDGHRCVVASTPATEKAPGWLDDGIIIDRLGLARALGYLASVKSENVGISYLEHANRAILSDDSDECSFKVGLVDGTFADYRRLLNTLNVFEGREIQDMASTAYSPQYLKGVGDIAKLLDADMVRLHGSISDSEPSLVTFPEVPEVIMMLMPMGQKEKALPAPTAQLLEGPIKRTIAALRAHQTRWQKRSETLKQKRGRDEADAKVAEYQERIDALLRSVMPALPAPKPDAAEQFIAAVGEALAANGYVLEASDHETVAQMYQDGLGVEDAAARLAEAVDAETPVETPEANCAPAHAASDVSEAELAALNLTPALAAAE